jgi:predicted nuclease of predicted toxin-antitoxin system
MKIWIDVQLSPAIAPWVATHFGVEVSALRDLGLRDATDSQIFMRAKEANAVVMTKDSDFVALVNRLGTPPQVIWLTCGNTSNTRLRQILIKTLHQAMILLAAGEPVIEIKDIEFS